MVGISIAWRDGFFAGYDHGSLSGGARSQRLFGGAALVCFGLASAFIVCANIAGPDFCLPGSDQTTEARRTLAAPSRDHVSPSAIANAYAKLSRAFSATARVPAAVNNYVALIDSRFSLGFPPATFVRTVSANQETPEASAAPSGGDQVAQTGALPPQKPRSPRSRTLGGGADASRVVADVPAEKPPSIFERLFGKPSTQTLAYASAEDGLPSGQGVAALGRYDRTTAVYDISAHVVYMPDGTTLEAHSGLGPMLDDPRHVDQRMRGPTPPTVYDLKPRESLFHGVQALRLIPVDEDKVYGRSGLLAHTFMLGPNGQSNGCVSFRNYNAFLRAYMNHEIKHLAVVARLD
jgi:Protein of unknown function (DUF2778)